MIGILIDAVVLVVLLQVINKEDVGLGTAAVVSLLASIGTLLLVIACAAVMGFAGLFVGSAIAAVLLGIAISAYFGVEIKRAFLIAGLFMVAHIGVGLGLNAMLH